MSSTPATPEKALDVLRSIQADNLLAGLPILIKAQGIRESMVYQDVPFAQHFEVLQDKIAAIGHFHLWETVEVGTASTYMAQLTSSYDSISTEVHRVRSLVMAFAGRVKAVGFMAQTLKDPFRVYWMLGASEIIENSALKKLNATDIKALASWEYSRLLDEADLELTALNEALEMTLEYLKSIQKLAQEKYTMGRDQVNAALAAMDSDASGGMIAPAQHSRSSSPSLKGMLGDRVKDPETSVPVLGSQEHRTTPVDLDDDDEPTFAPPAVKARDKSPAEEAEQPSPAEEAQAVYEVLGAGDHNAPAPAVSGPQPGPLVKPEPTPEEQAAGTPLAEAIAAAEAQPVEVKKHDGVCHEPVDINCPGMTHRGETKLQRAKSFVILAGQADPEENGKWIWMGADKPLVREVPKLTPGFIKPDVETTTPAETPVARDPQPVVAEPAATVEQLLVNDPFLGPTKGKEIADALTKPAPASVDDEEDDFPANAVIAPVKKGIILVDEEDEQPVVVESETKSPFDTGSKDTLRAVVSELNGDAFKDQPAQVEFQELPAGAKGLDLDAELEGTTRAITTATQLQPPPPPSPAVASKPAGLFRPKGLAPGTVAAPTFVPKTVAAGVDDDLEEFL